MVAVCMVLFEAIAELEKMYYATSVVVVSWNGKTHG